MQAHSFPWFSLYQLLLQLEQQTDSKNFLVSEEVRLQLMAEAEALPLDWSPTAKGVDLEKTKRDLVKNLRSHECITPLVLSILLAPLERLFKVSITDVDILKNDSAKNTTSSNQSAPLIWVLHNIRSAFNVGSFFRSADALGVQHIHLVGYTPTPDHPSVNKASLGSEQFVSWSLESQLEPLLERLKPSHHLIALETVPTSENIYVTFQKKPSAFIFGNERFGLHSEALDLCHETRNIPMAGRKNSLNVVVAAAIAGSEWMRQWNQHQ